MTYDYIKDKNIQEWIIKQMLSKKESDIIVSNITELFNLNNVFERFSK